jgi:hypothetical protein
MHNVNWRGADEAPQRPSKLNVPNWSPCMASQIHNPTRLVSTRWTFVSLDGYDANIDAASCLAPRQFHDASLVGSARSGWDW